MTEELKNCLCGRLCADESEGWKHCLECDMWVGAVVAHCYCGAAEPPRETSGAFVASILTSLQNNSRADIIPAKPDIEWIVCDKCGACSHLACYPEIAALDATSFAEKSFFCKECGQKDRKSGPAVTAAEKPVGVKPVDDDGEDGQDETKVLATTRRFSPAHSTFSMLKPPLKLDTPSTSSSPLISKKASQKASKKTRPEPDGVSTFVQCPDCPMISGSRGAIRTHCVSFHNHSKSDVVRASYNFQLVPKPDRWRCVRCPNQFFKNNSALCAHWASAHNNNKSNDKSNDKPTNDTIKNPLSNNNAIGTDVSSKVAQAAQLANIAKTYITTNNTLATASHTTTTGLTTAGRTTAGLTTAGYAFYRRAPPPPRTLSTTVSTPFRSSATTASTTTILPPYRVSNAPKRLFAPYSPPTVFEEPLAFQEQSQAKKQRKSHNIDDDLTPPRFIDSTADNGADDDFYKDEYDTLDSYLKESIDKDDIAVDIVDRQSDTCATSNSNVLSNALSSTNTASTNAAFIKNNATVSNAVSNVLSENVASLSTVQSVASSAVPVQMSLDMASTFMSTFMSALTRQKLALVEKEMEKEMQKQMTQKKNDEAPLPPPPTIAPIDYLPPHEEIAQQQQQPEQSPEQQPEQSPAEKKEQVVFQQAVDEQLEEEEEEQPIICDGDDKFNEPKEAVDKDDVDKDDDMCGKGTEQCRVAFARNFPFKSAAQIDKWCSLLAEHEIETIYDLRTLDSTTFDLLCSKIGASLLFQDLLVKLRK
jgi:hypothetical protein